MTIDDVISSPKTCSKISCKWFEDNFIKAYSDKSHLLLSSESDVIVTANINSDTTSNSWSEKLLGVTIDYKPTFDEHVS